MWTAALLSTQCYIATGWRLVQLSSFWMISTIFFAESSPSAHIVRGETWLLSQCMAMKLEQQARHSEAGVSHAESNTCSECRLLFVHTHKNHGRKSFYLQGQHTDQAKVFWRRAG